MKILKKKLLKKKMQKNENRELSKSESKIIAGEEKMLIFPGRDDFKFPDAR